MSSVSPSPSGDASSAAEERLAAALDRATTGERFAHGSPLRVAWCITELDVGGAERMLTALVSRLDQSQWDSTVFCLGPAGPLAQVLIDQGVPVHCLGGRGILDAPRVLWTLARHLRELRPTIVCSFLFHANLMGRLAARAVGVPFVTSGIRVADRDHRWHLWLDRWTNRLVDLNVCVSEGVAHFSETVGGLPPRKTVVIPNGVDIADLRRRAAAHAVSRLDLGLAEGERMLLAAGRLVNQKGFDVLLRALARLQELDRESRSSTGPTTIPDWRLVVVGDGPERGRLMEQARDLSLSERVLWLGRRNDLPALLAAADLFVLPSRYEGMANVLLEAAALGCPFVSTAVEGTQEIVERLGTGRLVPSEDPEALAAGIAAALSAVEVERAAAAAAQRIVQKDFTLEAMADRYARTLADLAAGTPPSRSPTP